MEWLKDKKNLPIVAGLMAVVVVLAGLLIAFELGAFNGGSSTAVAQTPTSIAAGYPGGYPGGAAGGYPGGAMGGYPGGMLGAVSSASAAPVSGATAAPPMKMAAVNPMVGADPFALPNGPKLAARVSSLTVANALRPPLREVLPPLNLFTLRPPSPPPASNFNLSNEAGQLLASTRVSGIVNAADGIFAVVEVNGASQTIKPGDVLPDGSKVASIQSSGVTLHTPGGGSITVPLSNGPPEQNQPNPYGGGFGGGYPGGGYPGSFGGGGYPGGGFPGGGYPGAGGFPGGGYPGAGGFPGGGGYPGAGGGEGGGGVQQ